MSPLRSIQGQNEWLETNLTDDALRIYRYLFDHLRFVESDGRTYGTVQVSQNRMAEEGLRSYYPTFQTASLRRKVCTALRTLEQRGIITRIKSDRWKQVNIYVINPSESWSKEARPQSPSYRRNLSGSSSSSLPFKPIGYPHLPLFEHEEAYSDPAYSDPGITISRSGIDHDLCSLERVSVFHDPLTKPLKTLTKKNRDPNPSFSPLSANSVTPDETVKDLPAAGSWNGNLEPFEGSEADWDAFEPEGLAFLHPDADWFWRFLLAWTHNQNERALADGKRGIGSPQKYAEAVIQANGASFWRQFEQTVKSWQQFACTLDWQYVQGNLKHFTYALERALNSQNQITRLGAGWLVVHNPQWGITLSNEGNVLIDPVVWEQMSSRLSLIKRELERLGMGEKVLRDHILTHFGTGQLSLLAHDQMQKWLAWLKLQPSPEEAQAQAAHESAQAKLMQQIATQVATDRAARKMPDPDSPVPPPQVSGDRSLESSNSPTPVVREEGEKEGASVSPEFAKRVTTKPVRKPVLKRRVEPFRGTEGVAPAPVDLAPIAEAEPQNYSSLLVAIKLAVQQLGWSQRQVQDGLRALFKADLKQDQLTGAQLETWLEYLQERIDEITARVKECWNAHKPEKFAPINIITCERTEVMMRLVQDLGGIDAASKVIASSLAYPSSDPFWRGRNIPFEVACPHIVEWHEQNLAANISPSSQQSCDSPFAQLSPEEQERYTRVYANDPSWESRGYIAGREQGA